MRRFALTIPLVLLAHGAVAGCVGDSLLNRLTPDQSADLAQAVADTPFAEGLAWTATRDGARIDLFGTMHLHDPRHDGLTAAFAPLVAQADLLWVEATAAEEAQLQAAIASDPNLIFLTDGPTLPEMLDAATWAAVAQALRDRGMPPFLASKFRPWFLMLTLSMPPCAMGDVAAGLRGLDLRLMDAARNAGVPVRALEPWDTLFTAMAAAPQADQIAMLQSGLMDAATTEALFVAMFDGYFAGRVAQVWELGRVAMDFVPALDAAEAQAAFDAVSTALLDRRNAAWVPQIAASASDLGHVAVAVGAAHLPGQSGVLALLQAQGWTVAPLR